MAIHLYLDAALQSRISEGDLSNPDRDEFNGTSGESKDRQLFLANEHVPLQTAMDAATTTVKLTKAGFADGMTIRIGTEEMKISSGGGTAQLTVSRGQNGTTAAAHAVADIVYSSYNASGIEVVPIDDAGSSETSWVKLATTQAGLATAVAGASLVLPDKTYAQSISFWRRCTVPAGTTVQNKTDLKLQVTATLFPVS